MENNNFKKTIDKIVNTLKKEPKYIAGIVLIVVFVIVLCVVGGRSGKDKTTTDNSNVESVKKNDNDKILELVNNYYAAYAEGDVDSISSYAMPLSDNEKEYIKLFSDYVDYYSVSNIYTKEGVDENSFLVSVEMEIVFKDIDTPAPGLDFFYVDSTENGELYIVNLYSQFNERTHEYVTEDQIEEAIEKYENLSDIKEVQANVQGAYDEAIANDENLDLLISSTISDAVSTWMSNIALVQYQDAPEYALADSNDDADESDDKSEVESDDNGIVIDPSIKVVEKAVTKDEVNMREGASVNKNTIKTLKKGTDVTVLAMDTWGEWSYVQVGKKKGYIRNDFLKTVESEHSICGVDGYPEVGDKVKVTSSANLLRKMSDKAKIITLINADSKVKIIMCYSNGYAKVMFNDKTGYIPTSYLAL